MKWFKRVVAATLLGMLALSLVVTPAKASYSSWTTITQIDGLSFVGRTGAYQNGVLVGGSSEIHCGHYSNGTWYSHSVPAGYINAYVQMYLIDGTLVGYSTITSTTELAGLIVKNEIQGTNATTYYVRGGGSVYNWHTGSCQAATYGWSWHTFYSPSGLPSSITAVAMRAEDALLLSGQNYSLTESGETYGSLSAAEDYGAKPDWISACATNGKHGYIDADDFWVPTPLNPADAVANFSGSYVRTIPVYDEPGGTTVVGYFDMHYGGSSGEAA